MVPDFKTQVPFIEKQIAYKKNLIDKNTIMNRTIEKRNCANCMQLWNNDINCLTSSVKNVT